MIRAVLIYLYMFIYAISGFIIWPILWIIRKFNVKKSDEIAFKILHFSCKLGVFVAGVKIEAKGLENLKHDGPVVYIINHRSIFDIIIAYAYFDKPTGFIAKGNLSKIPVFRHWLILMKGLFLDRSDIRDGARVIQTGVQYIKDGISMAIFPEGTRNRNNENLCEIKEFHGGSFKLATWSNAPLVPIVFYNTAAIFENHKPFIKSTRVKMTVCPQIDTESLDKDQRRFIGRYVHDIMQEVANGFEK